MLSALDFLISNLGRMYIFVVLLRFALQWSRADFYNPISQFCVKATNPLLIPLRKLIPGWRGYDWASLVLAWLLCMLFIAVRFSMLQNAFLPPQYLILFGLVSLISLIINMYFWLILIEVILSWVNPQALFNASGHVISQLNAPLVGPIRRLLPHTGLDFSPMIVMILLKTVEILITNVFGGSLL